MTRSSGVEGGALWAFRWSTHQRRAALGRNRGSPDDFCPIFPNAVLLGRERQRNEVGSLEIACQFCGLKDSVAATECSICEAERSAL